MLLCRIFQCSKYHAKIQSFVYPVHLVLSLNCLPAWSYSVSQLTTTVLYSRPKCTKCRRLIIAFHRMQTENLYLLHILIGKYPTWTGLPYHKQLSFTKVHQAKAARGHATPRSLCIDGIVLSVTKNNILVQHVKHCIRQNYRHSTESFMAAGQQYR